MDSRRSTQGPRLNIRAAIPSDHAIVAEILAASYPALMRGHYPDLVLDIALPLMTRPHAGLLGSGTYFIASGPDRDMGCGGWSVDHPVTGVREDGLAHIRHFAVRPEALGHGVGGHLFERCLFDARTMGAERLQVLSSLNAEGFYARMGCRPLHQVDVPLSPSVSFAAILMERAL